MYLTLAVGSRLAVDDVRSAVRRRCSCRRKVAAGIASASAATERTRQLEVALPVTVKDDDEYRQADDEDEGADAENEAEGDCPSYQHKKTPIEWSIELDFGQLERRSVVWKQYQVNTVSSFLKLINV